MAVDLRNLWPTLAKTFSIRLQGGVFKWHMGNVSINLGKYVGFYARQKAFGAFEVRAEPGGRDLRAQLCS